MQELCDSVEVTDEDGHSHDKSMHRNSHNPEVWPVTRIHRSGEPDKTRIHPASAPATAYMLGSIDAPENDHQAAQPSASASGTAAVPPAIVRSNNNSIIIDLDSDVDPDEDHTNHIEDAVNHRHPHHPSIQVNQSEALQEPPKSPIAHEAASDTGPAHFIINNTSVIGNLVVCEPQAELLVGIRVSSLELVVGEVVRIDGGEVVLRLDNNELVRVDKRGVCSSGSELDGMPVIELMPCDYSHSAVLEEEGTEQAGERECQAALDAARRSVEIAQLERERERETQREECTARPPEQSNSVMIPAAPQDLHSTLRQTVHVIVQQVIGQLLPRQPGEDMYIAVSESVRGASLARAPGPPPRPITEVFEEQVQQERGMFERSRDDGVTPLRFYAPPVPPPAVQSLPVLSFPPRPFVSFPVGVAPAPVVADPSLAVGSGFAFELGRAVAKPRPMSECVSRLQSSASLVELGPPGDRFGFGGRLVALDTLLGVEGIRRVQPSPEQLAEVNKSDPFASIVRTHPQSVVRPGAPAPLSAFARQCADCLNEVAIDGAYIRAVTPARRQQQQRETNIRFAAGLAARVGASPGAAGNIAAENEALFGRLASSKSSDSPASSSHASSGGRPGLLLDTGAAKPLTGSIFVKSQVAVMAAKGFNAIWHNLPAPEYMRE